MERFYKFKKYLVKVFGVATAISILISSFYFLESTKFKTQVSDISKTLEKTKKELSELKTQDQIKINE